MRVRAAPVTGRAIAHPARVPARPAGPPGLPGALLGIQRSHGNRVVQRLLAPAAGNAGPPRPLLAAALQRAERGGSRMDLDVRAPLERAFGVDLGQVKIHRDALAGRVSRALSARAFTTGPHIFFGPGEFDPGTAAGRRLLAHEVTHVVQQGNGAGTGLALTTGGDRHEREAERAAAAVLDGERPRVSRGGGQGLVQRRLYAHGAPADVKVLIGLLEPASGFGLAHDPATGLITITVEPGGRVSSPTLAARLREIIEHPSQHAEISLVAGLRGATIGAFPAPPDLTAGAVQRIAISNVEALERAAPGHGVAVLVHEIYENFVAHRYVGQPPANRFDVSHTAAFIPEAAVLWELVPGLTGAMPPEHRAHAGFIPDPKNTDWRFMVTDYGTHYLIVEEGPAPGPAGTIVLRLQRARTAPHMQLSTDTIGGFAPGSDVVPAGSQPVIARALASLRSDPFATGTVVGSIDSGEAGPSGVDLGRRRAESVRRAIVGKPEVVGGHRLHVAGSTATSGRQVVVTVTRPDIPKSIF
jgi:hypothetical protein